MVAAFGDTILRLTLAVAGGMAIGINRDLAGKPIGMRTLGLVALGASAVTVETTQFHDLVDNPLALARVLQGIIEGTMAGIGFLGAGVILRDVRAREVEGLTTAASVWVTAALGIACGLAAWPVAGTMLVLTLLLLGIVRKLEAKLHVKKSRGSSGR
jgi:putative Mg2+ transporter-C (MgtC) family protein